MSENEQWFSDVNVKDTFFLIYQAHLTIVLFCFVFTVFVCVFLVRSFRLLVALILALAHKQFMCSVVSDAPDDALHQKRLVAFFALHP